MSDATPQTAMAGRSPSPRARPGDALWLPRPGSGPRFDRRRPLATAPEEPSGDGPDLRADRVDPAEGARVVTLVFVGMFDAFAVVRARKAIAEMSERDQLVLDIGKVHEVDWCALASLAANALGLAPRRVSLTGYSAQQARLLAYLKLGALLEPAPAASEEPTATSGTAEGSRAEEESAVACSGLGGAV